MLKAIIGVYAVGAVIAAVGEAVTAAIIAGLFSVLNSVLLWLLHRRTSGIEAKAEDIQADQKATRAALTAPRRIVYDQNGDPIGTVIDLRQGDDWDKWLAQHSRRADDDPPTSPPPIPEV